MNRLAALRSRRRMALAAVLAAVSVVSCVLRMLTPHWVIVYNVDDDQLYVKLGHALINGKWLGAFDSRILERPPGFSFFLALAHYIPLPLQLVQQLLLLSAAALAAWALYRISHRLSLAVCFYIVVALDPTSFGSAAARLIRDSWYSSLCLALFAFVALAIPVAGDEWVVDVPTWRRQIVPALVGALAGVVLTGYWLGRSDRPWLLPALGLLLVGALVLRNKAVRLALPDLPRKLRLWRCVVPVAVASVVAVAVTGVSVLIVEAKNEAEYGVDVIEDMYAGPFADLYGRWQSVQVGPARRFVHISAPQREAVYEVSPSARRLAPMLEDPANIYRTFGCDYVGVCDDFVAGWFAFAVREATFAVGEFDSADEAHAFWSQIERDISVACDDGRLECGYPMPALLPSPSRISYSAWADSTWVAFDTLIHMGQADPVRPLSGTPTVPDEAVQFQMFRDTVRGLPDSIADLRADEVAAQGRWDFLLRVADVYSWGLMLGGALACLGYLAAVVRRRPGWVRMWIVGIAAGVAVAIRLLVVGLVDSTVAPIARTPNYLMPVSALSMLFIACGLTLFVNTVRSLSTERRQLPDASTTAVN